ncbi:MalY/PatB family protein [Oryzihumus leptocrescens]|uniref:cysteine-S-conjugate beta-lyase n=1 Tax=Oryzihumus leptocrescens TaxID=297536 RepID=A0A542ZLS5_9MICO|nr:aminotransferase class I/II-fold pyridoxal phosphate-dependent enzyme [Oryzihumus leptocrescens]TQL61314.1 cystathionine beta-lyase [Oryzihumus leptocrescens]
MSLVDLTDEQLRARGSIKWTFAAADVLPAWVAEMDFALAEPISAALHDAVDRGDVGYPALDEATGVPEALATFAGERWGWSPDPASVVLTGDVMAGVRLALETLCEDAPVVVPTPAYMPFLDVVPLSGRQMVTIPLDPDADRATLDLDRVEAAFSDGARTLLLSNPHNPWGRAFTRAELEALRDVVARHGARVISDEIHAPLVLPGHTHIAYASLDGAAEHTTTLMSASKAWNVPGLKSAQLVAGSRADLRALRALPPVANHGSSPLGHVAARAAYREGLPWLSAVLQRLEANRALLVDLVAQELPGVRMRALEATYLAWLDARCTGLANPAGAALERGRVLVNDGATFGPGGQGHVRVNLATSPERVAEVVRRLTKAWGDPA